MKKQKSGLAELRPTNKYKRLNHYHEITRHQKLVKLGGRKFVADKKMLPLLRALNNAGFKTRSHCYGHSTRRAWFSFILDKNVSFYIQPVNENPRKGKFPPGTMEVHLMWKRPRKF